MHILGIESSCDDTSVALVEATENGFVVVSEKTSSQIEVHKKYGGVIPEIAGRMHAENIIPVVEEVMKNQNKPDVVAVTSGPGLITGLLVGVETGKTLSNLWNIPLVSVNHIDGHIHSVELKAEKTTIEFPAICLVVSGGHTELLLMTNHNKFELLGKTRDDASGETFDKVAKLIGFEYPGGAKISKEAENGNPKAIDFPRPMIQTGYEFSFAGLKTSALYWLRDNPKFNKQDFCASFETAIVDVLTTKTIRSIKEFNPKTVILAGGVSANKKLRETLGKTINKTNAKLLIPEMKYTMDNAAMIAVAGYYKTIKNNYTDWKTIEADPNWKVYTNNNE
ncbi:MAG: tRNA (adenosine(37)-N6)-threonylcarbamoyltransferase complex transferase subunit TsaD [Candidatus Magasanikbacteria bacterium RIFCSPLOWO2_12_FULL_34_7]|nr:MAG: tRNA (adenosine(37)-N6)-threonylcarbamoyltransferase complex transferase subunit TsaD [Candidatus Magasanikbacteria bacterium RIFCSPLOWO2_12_FULL_34_7]